MTDDNVKKKREMDVILKIFFAGGLAGCCSKTTVAPLDRVKILLQAHNTHYRHLGVLSAMKHVIAKEGPTGLYRGNGAQMVRVFPYAAIQFGTFEHCKKHVPSLLNISNQVLTALISGTTAGITAVIFTYPLDMVRARLAFQVAGETVYTGIAHTFKIIIHQEGGLKALYRGMTPTLLGMAPYAGISFCCFETLKKMCLNKYPSWLGKPCPKNTGGLVLIIPAKLLCGSIAGAIAQTVSYPLDVVRRHMQLQLTLPQVKSDKWYEMLLAVFRTHGIRRGLFRGLSVNYIRVVPMVAVSFSAYELFKQMFNLDTGVNR